VILHLHPNTLSPTAAELTVVVTMLTTAPFSGVRNVTQSMFSVARHYGGMTLDGHGYTYLPADDSLWRDDVLRAVLLLRHNARQPAAQPAQTQEPLR
jgi:hypothetical protein